MAEDQGANTAAESKGGGLKLVLIVAAIMLVEGVGVFLLVTSLGGPDSVEASELKKLEDMGEDAPKEIALIEDQFQNMSTGHVWEWRVQIFLRVKQKNVAYIQRIMKRDSALIREGVALIFRQAQDRHLREPGLETITRQLTTYLNEVFGTDAEGIPRIDRVIIPECKGFRADA